MKAAAAPAKWEGDAPAEPTTSHEHHNETEREKGQRNASRIR